VSGPSFLPPSDDETPDLDEEFAPFGRNDLEPDRSSNRWLIAIGVAVVVALLAVVAGLVLHKSGPVAAASGGAPQFSGAPGASGSLGTPGAPGGQSASGFQAFRTCLEQHGLTVRPFAGGAPGSRPPGSFTPGTRPSFSTNPKAAAAFKACAGLRPTFGGGFGGGGFGGRFNGGPGGGFGGSTGATTGASNASLVVPRRA
jgi:hypothetical protein